MYKKQCQQGPERTYFMQSPIWSKLESYPDHVQKKENKFAKYSVVAFH